MDRGWRERGAGLACWIDFLDSIEGDRDWLRCCCEAGTFLGRARIRAWLHQSALS